MDPICHTLAGAALGEAGLKRRTALGLTTLMLAANAPDIDVAVFATDTLAMSFRRGWTHGVLALMLLPIALTALISLWDLAVRQRRRQRPPPVDVPGLLLLSYIGVWSHSFLDFLNSYGVRLLMPWSERWFYGDALYIVDPWMYLILGAGVFLARRRARRGERDEARPARLALAAATLYIALMLTSNWWARSAVAAGLERAGRGSDLRFMVTPVAVNPFNREVIVDTGDRYEKGTLWFAPFPRFRPSGYGVGKGLEEPLANRAMLLPEAQAFLRWSRFPFFVVDPTAPRPRIYLNDFRYSSHTGRDGWAGLVLEP